MVYEFIDQKLLRKIKLKSKTLIPAADVERLIRALHDGTLSVGKRQPRDDEAAKNAAHKERMRTRRAQNMGATPSDAGRPMINGSSTPAAYAVRDRFALPPMCVSALQGSPPNTFASVRSSSTSFTELAEKYGVDTVTVHRQTATPQHQGGVLHFEKAIRCNNDGHCCIVAVWIPGAQAKEGAP